MGHTPEDFPVAYRHQNQILSIPLYPEIEPATMEAVADAIREATAS